MYTTMWHLTKNFKKDVMNCAEKELQLVKGDE